MKNLFRIAFIASLVLASLSSNAQAFIVKGGFTMSSMTSKSDHFDNDDDYKMKPGFHVGAAAEIPVVNGLCFEPGVMFQTKGFKAESEGLGVKQTRKTTLNYIDIPLNVKYRLDLGSIAVFGSVGPYVGIGIGGKDKFTVTAHGKEQDIEHDIKFGSDKEKDHFKMLDYGLGIGAGVELGSIVVGVYYNIGMANLSNVDIDNAVEKNNFLNISLGYKFGGK